MDHAPASLLNVIRHWPAPAQTAAWACRMLFHQVASERALGTLDESLKWGQPAWRPRRPRTGSTLRMGWSTAAPDHLMLFVDCKTDLASRISEIYPALRTDGRREILLDLGTPLPQSAVTHLADMTFTYHLSKRAATSMG